MTGDWGVVLGVSSGTGAAIARALARDPGLHIFGAHRGHYQPQADALEAELASLGRRTSFRVGDAGSAEAASLGAKVLLEVAGRRSVRVFVHSLASASLGPLVPGEPPGSGASSSPGAPGAHLTARQIERSFAVMAHSFVYWVQELLAHDLLAPGARVFGLTNTMHDSLVTGCGVIAAAKGALEMYVRQLALELGPLGHRANLLKFGTVITPALARMMGPDTIRSTERVHAQMNPAGRICTVEEVAGFVSLLADPRAEWMNGATIDFTGGATLKLTDVIVRNIIREKKND